MKRTAEFLLEIGCEEIPAQMIARAASELKVILEKHLGSERILGSAGISTYGGPRRLVAVCHALLTRQPDVVEEVTGPPRSVAYDNVGRPTKAAESFAARQGVPVAKLYTITTPRGEYVAARRTIPGRLTREILPTLLPTALASLAWPRTMYWREPTERFVRPVRWILALLDGRVVPFTFAGVRAANWTSGHRALGRKRIAVRSFADYIAQLRRNYVLVEPERRRQKITRELRQQAARAHLRVHEDAELLDLVVYLNEFPTVIRGEFGPEFLQLPREILITVMRDHQKNFALERSSGELAPQFLAVINLDRDVGGRVRAGHERVLRARFSDASFFWEVDQKTPLGDNLAKLAAVIYESRLGSYADKTARMRELARTMAEQLAAAGIQGASVAAADRAAELAKCDLVTEMVREFPELQGIVGGLYAARQGEPAEIAWAIYDHYRPAGMEDALPRNLTGCILSLADKLDALVGCFAIGLIPTGSSDPFALRRAALGIVKVLLEKNLPLSLGALVAAASRTLQSQPPRIGVSETTQQQVLEFLLERARFIFRERYSFPYDEVNAVMAAGADSLLDARQRLEALHSLRRTRNFEPLAAAFKRIRNIVEKAGPAEHWRLPEVRADLLTAEAEKELHRAALRAAQQSESHRRAGRYREALLMIAELRPVVDRFFDEVLVMTEQDELRQNRLTLLAKLLQEFSRIADFSEIAAAQK
ncbi:MAG: glycine--tRNA ligase subunit beta [Firmicutes bacterium]|nr:glycine--tRNA ligase subunit beta [Bacillota bacterium]